MAEQTEKLPVRSILRVVVVVMITMVNGQLAQALAGKLAGAAAAHVRVHFQGLVAVAHLLVALGVGEDAVEAGGGGGSGGRTHGVFPLF